MLGWVLVGSRKQIVPRLADQGRYIASESSVYRILREQGQLKHREASRPAQRHKPQPYVATGSRMLQRGHRRFGPGTSHTSGALFVACFFTST